MTEPTFLDFDLRVFKAAPGAFIITGQLLPDSGLAQGMLDWAAVSSDDFKGKLQRIREEPYTTDEALFKEVGATLFDALFRGDIRELFVGAYRQRVQSQAETYLRLRMDIGPTASAVAVLPWEFMVWNDMFLATQTKTLITRQLLDLSYGDITSLAVKGPPRVLLVIPRGSGLKTDEEEQVITEALDKAGIAYEVLKGRVSVKRVREALATNRHHILHFIGHGEFEESDDGALHGTLRFNGPLEEEDESFDEEWVKDSQLSAMLGVYEKLRLVVLNACKGAELSEQQSGRGFIGTAPAILKARIPAVVAMQYSILDPVAIQFGETFYRRLTEPGPWAGHVDIALTLARNACLIDFPKDRGFATPILYLRSRDGKIFDIEAPPPNGNGNDDESACAEPARPPDELLHEHRHDTLETLVRSVEALRGRIGLVQQNIDYYEDLIQNNPLMATAAQAERMAERGKQDKRKLQDEMDGKLAVMRWKAYEVCQEAETLQAKLKQRQDERQALEDQNRHVPYQLQNEIADTQRRLRDLQEWLKQADGVR